jgi:subtilisin family serine protease
MFLREYTGRGVRVAVVDSGVHATHPHVGGVEQGIAVRQDGSLDEDFVDRLGHGTAVTAAVREKSPDAGIIVVKVFWRTLTTDITSLVRGIDEATARGAAVINLSLGTSNAAHRPLLQEAVHRASVRRAVIVAAIEDMIDWLPGTLDGVIPAALDWSCPRDQYRLITHRGRRAIAASGYPRDIPNVPPDRNLKGISFAVANASGFVARACEMLSGDDRSGIWKALETGLPDAGLGS